MCQRLREATIQLYHNYDGQLVHRVTIVSQSLLVAFLDSAYLLYSLKDRQIVFAKSDQKWDFRDTQVAQYQEGQIAVYMKRPKTTILLHFHTGVFSNLAIHRSDNERRLIGFPRSAQLLIVQSGNSGEKEYTLYPSGNRYSLITEERDKQEDAFDEQRMLVSWNNTSFTKGNFDFELLNIESRQKEVHNKFSGDRMWVVQSIQRYDRKTALLMLCRTLEEPAALCFYSLAQGGVFRLIPLQGMTLMLWFDPGTSTAWFEEFMDLSKRRLSVVRIQGEKAIPVSSLDLRPDEMRVDCSPTAKVAVYLPLIGKVSGKGFKVCRSVGKNNLSIHLMDKLGLLKKYSYKLGEEVLKLLNQQAV